MHNFLKGFLYAYEGLVVFFRHERNGRIQLLAALAVIVAAFILDVNKLEWIALIACIAVVLSLEMVNSAIEKICNLVHPAQHPAVKIIKDMAAAAVLWAAVCSVAIAAIIFLPRIF